MFKFNVICLWPGEVDEEMSVDQDKDWTEYWRLLFPKVTAKDIEDFAEKYRGEKL